MILLMLDALRERLSTIVQDLHYPVKGSDEERVPVVYDGYLPPKERGKTEDEYPFVIPRCEGGRSDPGSGGKVAEVVIYIGVFRETGDGCRDIMQIIERIMAHLTEEPRIDSRYVVDPPFTWDVPSEQPWPEWIGMLRFNVSLPERLRVFSPSEENEIYGAGYNV